VDFPLFDFILASLLMGLGICLDVAIATAAKAKQLSTISLAYVWIVGVSVAHTIFPLFGCLLSYFSIKMQTAIEPIIGLMAFTGIFYYLKSELTELAQPKKQCEDKQLMVTLGLILAVSWDALWSGPAKSAQVIGWPEFWIWISFLLVGVFVSVLAIASLSFALHAQRSIEESRMSRWLSLWVQYSVIGYFGLLAILRYTLNIHTYWWQVLLLSALLIAVAMSLSIVKATHNQVSRTAD
jgi:hypothetical protein